MVSIEATNLTSRKVDLKEIKKNSREIINRLKAVKKFPFLKNSEISVVFVGPGKIRELNKKYRKKDKPTDILSFTLERNKSKLIGEIILCPAVIKTKDYGISNWITPSPPQPLLNKEGKGVVNRLLAHGILHLCGFDHKTEKEWRKMEKIAGKINPDF